MVCNLLEVSGAGVAGAANSLNTTAGRTNVLWWHNTVAGERHQFAYTLTTNTSHTNYSVKFCSESSLCLKQDVFNADGTQIGAWAALYGVGWKGNHSGRNPSFPPNYSGIRSTIATWADTWFVDEQTLEAGGVGNGDYRPASGSALRGKIATAADVVIPYDLDGRAFRAGSAAGVYSSTGPGTRRWSY
jgi:hypothetical protein